MNPYATSIFLSSLATGTTITFISNHWFLAWMGLEINTLAMIPLMVKPHHPRAIESAVKYFMIQATSSATILFASTLNAWQTGEWTIMNNCTQMPATIMTIALMMKLAIAPFHLWLPDVIQGLNLTTGLILLTWQKLAPMALLFQMSQQLNTNMLILTGLLSILIGGWGGLNQTQLRKIMAYSSIAHLGWMIIILMFSPTIMLLNFIIYLIMTTSMFMMLTHLKVMNINKLAISWTKNPTLTSMMMIMLLTLGGLPPMTGFLPKWLILEEITKQEMTTLAVLMAMSALLSLFFYLRLAYTISLTTSPNLSYSTSTWRYQTKSNPTLSITIIISLLLLPLTPMTNILS
uniref:NADH-ubiquinone oxidoreductase chain 2 n=1 Tax=Amphiuma tridactylum TaxID=8313 RepID=Q2TF52_9SALA|nr:NADH dehydrogenase subunit 2 [Amphiuma tridactylum]